jgi:hypothetical protein
MRNAVSLVLLVLLVTRSSPAAPDSPSLAAQLTSIRPGARIEVRLNNNQKLRGARGAVSTDSFTLVEARAGDRQIAFADVLSVKKISHTKRNVLIIVAIGVVAVAVAGVILWEHRGPYAKL